MGGRLRYHMQNTVGCNLGADRLAEPIQCGQLGGTALRGVGLVARAPGQAAGNNRHGQKRQQTHDILGIGDCESMQRLDKEKVEAEKRQHRSQHGRPQPDRRRADQHHQQIQERDIGLMQAGKLNQRQRC
jgi:hypothetical protein